MRSNDNEMGRPTVDEILNTRYCLLDDCAHLAQSLPPSDPELKQLLSFNPIHNKRTASLQDNYHDDQYFYDTERPIIETDRTGYRYYDRMYSYYLNDIKHQKLNVLEIGIEWGYGVLAWSRYFKNANVHGMDLNKNIPWQMEYNKIKEMFPQHSQRTFLHQGCDSAYKTTWEKEFINEKFDVVIDDGSHFLGDQVNTLKASLPYLNNQCWYFIEDVKINEIRPYYQQLLLDKLFTIVEEGNFEIAVYKHVNTDYYNFTKMTRDEKICYIKALSPHSTIKQIFEKIQKKQHDHQESHFVQYSIALTRK